MYEIKNKKIMYSFIGIAVLLISLVGVTYAFFNYTRTGAANNFSTGRIYFNSTQDGRLELSNIFPVKASEVDASTLDSVSVNVLGDTTYTDGEEFQVTLVDVVNTVNGKKIQINYIATYTANTDAVIGTESNDYWNARESKDASIYTLESTGSVEEGKQVLVGYIDNGTTGINGTLTIKAYIDAEKIAITDTYPRGKVGEKNTNMSITQVNDCVSYLSEFGIPATEQFCNGTGTIEGPSGSQISFQDALNQGLFDSEMVAYFVNHNIVNDLGENDTTTEWVNGRTVLTTEEWNSFQTSSTPISFKIRAESNEGIWVEREATPASCFTTATLYIRNPNMNVNTCVSKLTEWWGAEEEGVIVDTGETYQAFCNGTGTNYGETFQEKLDNNWFYPEELTELESAGIIINQGYTTTAITGYDTSCGSDVVIPSKINAASVTTIGGGAFRNNQLTSVIIPNSVTTIGNSAFYDNNLSTLKIGDGVTTIGDSAFAVNDLTSVTIGKNVLSIGEDSFTNNRLTNVILNNRLKTIGSFAFGNAKGNQCTSCNNHFYLSNNQNNISQVTIPASVESMPCNAFSNNPNGNVINTQITYENPNFTCSN